MANRTDTYNKLKSDPKFFVQKSQQLNLSLGETLQEECPTMENSWNHPVVAKDFLARDELNLKPNGRTPASFVHNFQEPHQRVILADYFDDIWTNSFSGNVRKRQLKFSSPEDERKAEFLKQQEGNPYLDLSNLSDSEIKYQLEGASSVAGFEPGTPFRPYDQGDLDFDALEPEIPYADLVQSVDILESFDKQIADYEVPSDEEMMRNTLEGVEPPEVRIQIGERTATFRRLAIVITLGDSQMNSNNNIIISTVARLVRNIGIRYDDLVSEELIKLITAIKPSAPDENTIDIGASPTGANLLEVQYAFTNGKIADRLLGRKSDILMYIDRLGSAYGGYGTAPAGSAAGSILAQPRIGNNMSRPQICYFVPNADVGSGNKFPSMADSVLNAFDSMQTATRMEFTRGEYMSEDFDGVKAIHQRTFAKHLGYYLRKDPPYENFEYA